MADFFLDQNAAPPTQPAVSDPAADFLAAEKSDLAEIEAGTDVVYDQVPTQEGGFQEIEPTETIETPSEFIPPAETSNNDGGTNHIIDQFDPFGGQAAAEPIPQDDGLDFIQSATVVASEPVQDLGEFESEPSVVPQPAAASEPVAPVYTMPKIEPEIIKQWREEFKLRTDKIEADADQEANEWRQAAKEALDKFYADRDEKMSQTRKMNRESADALKLDNDSFDPTKDMNDQEKWDQVTQRIDFNAKGSCTKDNSRMRQVLLQLKAGKSE